MIGTQALAEARRWVGTPYVHQASLKGAGTDCLGLVRGVWRALYGDEPARVPFYAPDWSEPSRDEQLLRAAMRHLQAVPVRDASEGDVLLFRMREGSVAKHLGIQGRVGEDASFIHAFSGHAVTESALSRPWARRIVARFTFPERD
ncbi:NlpC/P60 family protein [Cognatishimia sp.]|uniref:NlpC/P60 family protein n=1 Tax=Cognatishimia sp. TaxID=2211648 RepID=UPI003514CA12